MHDCVGALRKGNQGKQLSGFWVGVDEWGQWESWKKSAASVERKCSPRTWKYLILKEAHAQPVELTTRILRVVQEENGEKSKNVTTLTIRDSIPQSNPYPQPKLM